MNKAVWSSILVAAMLLAVAGMADAQQQEKIRRIGFLSGASLNTGRVQAFAQGLPDLGYFEGKNIAIEYRLAEGKAASPRTLISSSASGDSGLPLASTSGPPAAGSMAVIVE